jgi:hypothetical protein
MRAPEFASHLPWLNTERSLSLAALKGHVVLVKAVCAVGDALCGELSLNEPNDVLVIGDVLYIADTNNHLIRTFDLQTRELGTLEIEV